MMVDASDVSRLAMAFAGTTRQAHFDRTAFKRRRIYATIAADGLTVNVRLSPEDQDMRCLLDPVAFTPVPNRWGRQGWTVCTLGAMDAGLLQSTLKAAWQQAGP